MFMTNGLGSILGGYGSGLIVDYFTKIDPITNNILSRDWPSIWFTFAAYALVLGLIFPFVFKYKHPSTALASNQ
jgi:NHS family xanthosine MFS transporter